jgi:gamma-hexachlorocyclohexane dehydrochlorinase
MGLLTDNTDATFVGATYRDRFERRGGVWKMVEREVVIHHFNGVPGTRLTKPEAD